MTTAVVPQDRSDRQAARTVAVGVGDLAAAAGNLQLTTHALGSCVAVCLWDPGPGVAALLHFLLPEAAAESPRLAEQPAAFASTGIPLLFETAYREGLRKSHARVVLVGGAEMPDLGLGLRQIGRRNVIAARRVLWANGVLIAREDTGGTEPRSVYLCARTGRLRVRAGNRHIQIE